MSQILDSAARIFDEVGYASTTTNDIAAEAHVSVGSLYQYFADKDAVLAALAERHVDEALTHLATVTSELRRRRAPVSEVVTLLVEATVDLNDSDALHRLLHQQAPYTARLQAQLHRLQSALVQEVSHHLCAGGHDPAAARTSAELVVSAVMASVHEVVLARPPGEERRHAAQQLTALLVRGLG